MRKAMTRRWLAPLLLMAALTAACGSDGGATAVEDAATTVAPTTTEAEPTTTTEAEAEEESADAEAEAADADAGPAVFDPDATLLTTQFQGIDPGTYRVDTIGTPLSITVGGGIWVQPNADAFFVLSGADSQGPNDKDLVFLRVTDLADPTNPGAPPEEQEGWPAADLEGWIAALTPDIEVTEPEPTTAGGLDALRFDISLTDSAECMPNPFFSCIGFATNRLVNGKEITPGATLRVWWVDQGDESPLMVVAGIARDSDSGWWETVDEMMATLAFGDVAPNPIPEGDLLAAGLAGSATAGTVTLPILGGLSFDLPADEFINQFDDFGYAAVGFGDLAASTEIFVAARTQPLAGSPEQDWAASTPLATIDEAIAWLTEKGATITEIEGSTLDGVAARVFDIEAPETSGPPPALMPLGVTEVDGFGWFAPPNGRLWMAETDLGILVVTAEVFESVDDLPATIERSEAIVASLDLVELG